MYVRPVVVESDDLAEGIFAASGTQITVDPNETPTTTDNTAEIKPDIPTPATTNNEDPITVEVETNTDDVQLPSVPEGCSAQKKGCKIYISCTALYYKKYSCLPLSLCCSGGKKLKIRKCCCWY